MRKPLLVLAGAILLVSLSCQFLFPQRNPTSQPQPTLEVATVPAAQPEPTQEQPPAPTAPVSTATLAPTLESESLVLLEDLTMMFWNAKVSYNPAIWQPGSVDNPPSLSHRELSTCRLYEQGPTEPPPPDREVTLGPVTYMVTEMESDGSPLHWYMAVKGPQGKFVDGTPTMVITSSPDQFEQCRSSAEEVLASMR